MRSLSNPELVILTVLYVVTFLIALLGNSFLICIIWKVRQVRSFTSILFVNMAVADLMVTFIVMPLTVYDFHANFRWTMSGVLGDFTCRAVWYLKYISMMASILCLMFMAIDRFYTFIFPLKSLNVWFRNAKYISPLIWVMSVILMFVIPVMYQFYDDLQTCQVSPVGYSNLRAIQIYLFLVTYLVPLVVMTVLYGKTAHVIWFRRIPGNALTDRQQEQQEITKRRMVRMLIIIVVVFAVCWFPPQVYHIYQAVVVFEKGWPLIAGFLSFWLAHANSAINPWLYIWLMGNMRLAFLKMLGKNAQGDYRDGMPSSQTTQRTRLTQASTESIPLAPV